MGVVWVYGGLFSRSSRVSRELGGGRGGGGMGATRWGRNGAGGGKGEKMEKRWEKGRSGMGREHGESVPTIAGRCQAPGGAVVGGRGDRPRVWGNGGDTHGDGVPPWEGERRHGGEGSGHGGEGSGCWRGGPASEKVGGGGARGVRSDQGGAPDMGSGGAAPVDFGAENHGDLQGVWAGWVARRERGILGRGRLSPVTPSLLPDAPSLLRRRLLHPGHPRHPRPRHLLPPVGAPPRPPGEGGPPRPPRAPPVL